MSAQANIALYNFDGRIAIRGCNDAARIDHIPPAVYRISLTPSGIDLIKDRASFEVPARIFGRAEQYANMIVQDFVNRPETTTGAIMDGLKGNGKSMTCELIANKAIKRDIPVILVDEAFGHEILLSVARLCAPCVLMFDEFGKVYSESRKETNEREGLLPLFSDSSLKQVLFLITSNTKEELNQYILDRPGRFKYRIEFGGMTMSEVVTVLDDFNLKPEIRKYIEIYCAIKKMSYDMIKTMAKYAEGCHTREDLIDMFTVLNVPNGWAWQVAPVGIYLNKRWYEGDCVWTQTNGKGHVALFDAEGNPGHVIEFDLDKDRRVDQGVLINDNGSSNLVPTNVFPSHPSGVHVRIKLNVRYGDEDGKGGTPTPLRFGAEGEKVSKKAEAKAEVTE